MKTIFTTLFLLSFIFVCSQERPHDKYYNEEQTYFSSLFAISDGLVMTDNYSSSIYLIKNGSLTVLFSAPGCGRYMKLSHDENSVLFKYINNNGQQVPAKLNLASGKIDLLSEYTPLCSQPFEDNFNNTGYCVPGNLIYKGFSHPIIGYVNNPALSGNGNLFVYNDDNDQLYLKDFVSGKTKQITDNNTGYFNPSFSPDDKYITFSTLSGEILLYKTSNAVISRIGKGGHIRWMNNANFIYTAFDENGNSSVALVKITSDDNILQNKLNLEEGAMFATVCNNSLYYTIQGTRQIYKTSIQKALNSKSSSQLIYSSESKLPISFFSITNNTKAIVKVPGIVPYVNQVYDTPTWHAGWGSCAPTTSVMAFAYYNRLPPWPVTVDHGQTWDPHVNNYGSYVADRYRFNELYYSETADAYGTTAYGGYGYMWTGSYSPNSRMKFYIENHYMTSNQLWTSSCTYNNTIIEINGGYVHPICNYLTTSGHLTLATGYVVGQHTLIFNDPYGNKNNPGYPNYTGYDSYYDWPGYNNGYQNLDASGSNGGVAWTVKSQTSQPLYNDTIIDNVDYNHGFYMSNVTNGSHMRYFHDFNTGYNGHTWWTYTMAAQSDICYTTWGPNLPQAGKYKVEVFIPSNGANASGARYHIHYNGGDTLIILDQVNYANQWVELGVFPFHSGQGDYVYLGDSTGIDNEMIAFDAMRWSFVPEISASFTSSNQIICAGETINYTNTCLHADSCKWILTGSDLNITNQPNPSAVYNSAGTYNVTLIAFSTYGNDTLYMPDYVTVNPLPQANFIAANTNIQLPGAIALFTNNSQNSSAYIWNFGDGALSTDQDPYHIYTSAGNFTVSLIASNGLCPSDTLIMTNYITVLNATDIFHNSSLTPVINANNGQLFILCGNTSLNNVTIKVTDEIGRNIITKEIERISTDFTFALPEIHGIFIISLSAENIESIFLKYVNY